MSEPKDQNEAACGGSALTAVLGALADQFECHAASRSIDQIEEAGRAMRAAKAEIDRLQRIIDGRPAINAGLPQTYIDWSRGIYETEWAQCVGAH